MLSFRSIVSTLQSPAAKRALVLTALVVGAALTRLIPHPWNVTPIGAMALFGGAHFANKRLAVLIPFGALLIGDIVTGFHGLMPFVYGGFALYIALGMALRDRISALRVTGAVGTGGVLFFLVTNFGVLWLLGTYPPTGAGLLACYAAGLPYLGATLLGDALFSTALFGGWALVTRRWPVLQRPTAAAPASA
jgi:hypothetical protein